MDYLKTHRNRILIYLLIFLTGFIHAVFLVKGNLDFQLPFSVYLYGDSEIYLNHALSILAGGENPVEQLFHPPLAQWFMVAVLKCVSIIAPSMNWKYLLALMCGTIALLTAILTAKINDSVPWILLAGTGSALSFGMAVISTVPGTEALYLVISLTAMAVMIREDHHSWVSALAIGVLTGLAALTRQEHIVFLPVAVWFTSRGFHHSVTHRKFNWNLAGIVCAGFIVTMLPTTVSHHETIVRINTIPGDNLDRLNPLAPVTVYGPLNFALANMPPSNGEFTREALPRINDQDKLLLFHPEHRRFLTRGYQMGLRSLWFDPGRAVALVGKKLTISWRAMSLGWTAGNFPAGLHGVRRPVDLFAPHRVWPGIILSVFTVLGWCLLWQKHRSIAVLFLMVLLHRVLVISLFYGYVRQGILLFPFAVILTAYVPIHLLSSKTHARIVVMAALLMIISGLTYDFITSDQPRKFDINYDTMPDSDRIDHQLRVEFSPKP